jgi:hypothetical protein
MTLWPVYIWSAMQEDAPMLFEVGDVVTWPVRLEDAGAPGSGGPTGVAVKTMVSLRPGPNPKHGPWAVTREVSAYWFRMTLIRCCKPAGPLASARAASP